MELAVWTLLTYKFGLCLEISIMFLFKYRNINSFSTQITNITNKSI